MHSIVFSPVILSFLNSFCVKLFTFKNNSIFDSKMVSGFLAEIIKLRFGNLYAFTVNFFLETFLFLDKKTKNTAL